MTTVGCNRIAITINKLGLHVFLSLVGACSVTDGGIQSPFINVMWRSRCGIGEVSISRRRHQKRKNTTKQNESNLMRKKYGPKRCSVLFETSRNTVTVLPLGKMTYICIMYRISLLCCIYHAPFMFAS